ncbi:N-carbamoylputrescine amidase [Acanthocystis turfacea Chlorella virus NTS-1]|nr:N-carbamoylputrescine amidase [Acanthocystis turfacea Chlorella virus NTS-1]
MTSASVAVLQFSMTRFLNQNLRTAENMARNAAANGAEVIVLPELFSMQYFCQEQNGKWFDHAETYEDSKVVTRFANLAGELGVVIIVSFFEKDNNEYYNSVVVADVDGAIVGIYRKTHIPQGPCYNEKFYFRPSDNKFGVADTKFGKIGIAICWDQWFPEVSRILALLGADLIVMPTAIGSEPDFPNGESYLHWARTIQGHSAANGVPIAVANRIGRERFGRTKIDFYGGSFITDNKGAIAVQVGGAPQENGGVDPEPLNMKGFVKTSFDKKENARFRALWGLFRDRRPELYEEITRQG